MSDTHPDNFPVILACTSFPAESATAPTSVVLRDFGPRAHSRYVTHCRNDTDGSHFWGHYHSTEATARADYAERVKRLQRAAA